MWKWRVTARLKMSNPPSPTSSGMVALLTMLGSVVLPIRYLQIRAFFSFCNKRFKLFWLYHVYMYMYVHLCSNFSIMRWHGMIFIIVQVAQVLLTLPYSFSQLGMLSGILFQIFYGLMGSWTAYLISILYVEYRTRKEREKADFRNHVIQVQLFNACICIYYLYVCMHGWWIQFNFPLFLISQCRVGLEPSMNDVHSINI